MRKDVENWWRQAERDLITAENCKNSEDYYVCTFFCQQSVEKAVVNRRFSGIKNL
jgi:HEPN domain-containing protein